MNLDMFLQQDIFKYSELGGTEKTSPEGQKGMNRGEMEYIFGKIFFDSVLVDMKRISSIVIYLVRCTGCNKIIAPCTRYTKKGIFYFCNRSNRLIYMYVR